MSLAAAGRRHFMPNPTIEERPAQPYVGVRELVTMETFSRIADRMPELIAWLAERGVDRTGPLFFRYLTIDMEHELDVEAGVPVASTAGVDVDGGVFAGTLPAGRYVTATHVGHPGGLVETVADLLRWADERGLAWDVRDTPAGQAWGCRLEAYRTDPREEPDMNRWEIALAFRQADGAEAGDA